MSSKPIPMSSPQKIGRYELVGELGRGAMGVVYRATDPNIGRTVALKTMRLDVHGVNEQEILRRFKHEAKLAGVMNHPNVVTIYDAGEDQGVFYIAMEYVEGITLQSFLREQRVAPAELMLAVSRQMCLAMDYAHQREVIHRDIKPANIMLSSQGGVKIMDFGIAKAAGGNTSAGQVLGTPAYMSPEQVRGKALDGRSDLFSYGVCLYEMLTGKKPFTGESVTTIIYKIMHEEPVPPQNLDVTIHPGISAVIVKALAKDPTKRYQSGAELMRDLENYKSDGSADEKTQVLSSSIAGLAETAKAPAVAAVIPAPTVATTSGKKLRKVASLISGKTGPVEAIESTVTVRQPAAQSRPAMLGARKITIMVVAMVIALGASEAIHRHNLARLATSTALTQPQAQTAPTSTEAAAGTPVASPEGKTSEEDKSAAPAAKPTAHKVATEKAVERTEASATAKPSAAISAVIAEEGSVHLASTPDGASVTIDSQSKSAWTTPFTAHKLSPGDHDLIFAKAGYLTQKRKIRVVAGKTASMGIALAMSGARVNVSSKPPGANILVDGKPTGQVTPSVVRVDAGLHKIMVRQEGYQEENTTVSLKDGESYDFSPTLEAMRSGGGANPFRAMKRLFGGGIPAGQGMVQIRSNPPGAQVFHQGKPWPKKTPLKGPVDPGTYQVTIRLSGYKPARRQFTVEKGKVTELNVDLEAK